MQQPALYDAILARRSVRRYDPTPLDEAARGRIGAIIAQVKPLVPEHIFDVLQRDVAPDSDTMVALGGYGLIAQPPHCLVPYMPDSPHALVDLGYRVEQIAVRMVPLGVGSCFVGVLKDEAAAAAAFGLPPGTRVGAYLLYGRPSQGLVARALGRAARAAIGARNKLPPERIFFWERFDEPGSPQGELAPLVEAARNAPSADNAQPWRLLWRDRTLYLFVRRHSWRYGSGKQQLYRFYDGGTCMANISLAMEAVDMRGKWALYRGVEEDVPSHPEDLEPLARLTIST
ncbi:MAG: hypothetical protein FJZ90_19195 [Chloroflexi bacterium]|nr:hypothetical protein [Chloroflexota bacterium]